MMFKLITELTGLINISLLWWETPNLRMMSESDHSKGACRSAHCGYYSKNAMSFIVNAVKRIFQFHSLLLYDQSERITTTQHSGSKGENSLSLIATQASLSPSFHLSTWHFICSGTKTGLFSPNIKWMSCPCDFTLGNGIAISYCEKDDVIAGTCSPQRRPWFDVCFITVFAFIL